VPARARDEVEGITAVASRVSEDYVRAKLPDGTFQPESYAFGEGGKWGGEISDPTIDKLHFTDVARVIALPLAGQKYIGASDPKTTKLLIMVYWGTTAVPPPISSSVAYENLSSIQAKIAQSQGLARAVTAGAAGKGSGYHPSDPNQGVSDSQMDELTSAMAMLNLVNRQRDLTDFKNAAMLGYDSTGMIGTDYGLELRRTPLKYRRDELISEIEENRYFVVLMAYDFQLMWKEKKHKLLWETRFSISERRNQFDKALPVMADYASKYFGKDSKGLLRTRVPEGRVDIGETKTLGEVEEPKK
jgi:hypothetical protein